MATAPTIRQTRTLTPAAGTVTGGFASPPLAGSLLFAVTELANPSAWDPGQTATNIDGWRALQSTGSVAGAGVRVLWKTASASEPATYAFRVRSAGGGVQLVEVTGGTARWVLTGQSAQVLSAPIAGSGAGTTATAPTPLTTFASGPSLLLAFWGTVSNPTTANGVAPGSGWTEEYEAAGSQQRFQLQSRAGDAATAYTPEATFTFSTAISRLVVAVAIGAADDAASGGPLDLNTWSRGESAGFLRAGGALPVAVAAAVAATGRLVAAEARPVAIAAALSERSDRLRRQLLLAGRITAPLAAGLDLAGTAVDRHTLALAADGAVRARPTAALVLDGRVLAVRTAALALAGRVVQHAAAALDLAGEVAPYLHYAPALALTGYAAGPVTQALVLAGRTKVASAAALGLGGRVATREAAPLAAAGRVRAGLAAALALSGYAQAPRTAGVGLAGAVRVGQTAALALGGRVAFPRLALAGRVVQHQARALALAGEVRDYALPPGAPASGYRTRLPWTAQERLRSLT